MIFLAVYDCWVFGTKYIKVVQLFIIIQHSQHFPFSIYLDPPFPPSEWSKWWLLPCSTCQFIYILWVTQFGKTVCQYWSRSISPLLLACDNKSLYLLLLSLVCQLLSPQMISCFTPGIPATVYPLHPPLLLLHCYNFQTLLLPHSLHLFTMLALIATVFMVNYVSVLGNIIIHDYHYLLLVNGDIFYFPWP